MNIYQQKFYWKIGLVIFAIIIVILSLYYNNNLAKALEDEERKKVELIAETWKEMNKDNSNQNFNFLIQIQKSNTTVPVIEVLENGVFKAFRNIGLDETKRLTAEDSTYVYKILEKMKAGYPPIVSQITPEKKNLVYYSNSTLLRQLMWYPYIQLAIIGAFLLIAYLAFSAARRAEQNQVWVGMARETAHQLGTPLSSLVAWIDMLQMNEDENVQQVANEMCNDTGRLELIADRFSKIGSKPKLEEHDLKTYLYKTLNYVKRRAAKGIKFSTNFEETRNMKANFSPPLLDWVIENLLKNALDAMEGSGAIHMEIKEREDEILVDVSDTGSGIPKSKFKDVFKPGFSSKKRGWGLGLSLSKRIVEEYHKGKISVHKSAVGKGTTFRILLPKKSLVPEKVSKVGELVQK